MLFLACPPAPALGAAPALDWTLTYSRTYGGDERWLGGTVDAAGNSHVLYLDNFINLKWVVYDATGILVTDTLLPDFDGTVYGIALDGSGNLLVGGTRTNGATGRVELLVAQYTSAGALAWASTYDTGFSNTAGAVAVDAAGNAFLAGYYTGATGEVAVLVKFDSGGVFQWARTVSNVGDDYEGTAVATDAAGNSYLAGSVFQFGSWWGFAAKFDAAGVAGGSDTYGVLTQDYVRAATVSGAYLYLAEDDWYYPGVIRANLADMSFFDANSMTPAMEINVIGGIAVDPSGNVVMAGLHWNLLGGNYDLGVWQFDSTLAPGWVDAWDGGGSDAFGIPGAARVGTDASGNVFVSAQATLSACATDAQDVFVRKYDAAGTAQWTRLHDLEPIYAVKGAVTDAAGAVYLGGDLIYDAVLVKHDSTGAFQWVREPVFGGLCTIGAGGVAGGAGITHLSVTAANSVSSVRQARVVGYDAAGTQTGVFTFNLIPNSDAGPVTTDAAGNVYMAGVFLSSTTSRDELYVVKFNSAGVIQWTRTYTLAVQDDPSGIAVDGAGGVYVAMPYPNDWVTDNVHGLIKLDAATGAVQWTRTYGGGTGLQGIPYGVCSLGGAVYLAGSEGDSAGLAMDGRLFRLDTAGNVVWTLTYDGGQDAGFFGVAPDPAGHVDLTGMIGSSAKGVWDVLTASFDPAGTKRWDIAYDSGGDWDRGSAVAIGSVFVGGSSGKAVRLIRYIEPCDPTLAMQASSPAPAYANAGDTQQWQFAFSNYGIAPEYNVTLTTQANSFDQRTCVAPSAAMWVAGGGTVGMSWAPDLAGPWTANEPPDGTGVPLYLRWVVSQVSPGSSGVVSYRTTMLAGAAVTVGSYLSATLSCDVAGADGVAVPFSVTASGARLAPPFMQLQLVDDPAHGSDSIAGVAVDQSGNVIAVGTEQTASGGSQWFVRKYNATLSVLLAATVYDGGVPASDTASSVAVDAAGNIVVAGTRWPTAGSPDWRVVKYDSGLTTILGATVYDAAGVMDFANAVVVDGTGNILVAGTVMTAGYVSAVRKYDASLTTLLAATSYGGPVIGEAMAHSLALDRSGNIVVVGHHWAGPSAIDWSMRTFDASLATVLSATAYSSAGFVFDKAYGVAVDPAGHVVVAGYAVALPVNNNWLVRSYDAGGDLLWSWEYDSPAGVVDQAFGITTDAGGSVVVVGMETRPDLGEGRNWRVFKLDNAGNLVDSVSHNGLASGDDGLSSVALLTAAGNSVVVGGMETTPGGGSDGALAILDLAPFDPPHPAAGLTAVAAGADINLAWTPAAAGTRPVSGYRVYRATYSGVAIALDNWYADVFGPATVAFSDTGVTNGIRYRYKVIPVDDLGASATSSVTANGMLDAAFLTAVLTVVPNQAIPGQGVEVRCRIKNTGLAPAEMVIPALEINTVALSVTLFAGPSPSGTVTLNAGASRTFIWSYSVTGYGLVTWTVTATGIDTGLGGALAAACSATLLSAPIAVLDAHLAMPAPSATVLVGQWFSFTLTLTNTGSLEARNLVPVVVYAPPGALVLKSGPAASLNIPVGSSTVLTWTYSVSGHGVLMLSATLTGDDGAGGVVSAGGLGTCMLARPATLESDISIAPWVVPAGRMVTVRVTVTNTGDMPLDAVSVWPVPITVVMAGTATVVQASGPVPAGPLTVFGRSSTIFTWTYSTGGLGEIAVATIAYGTDSGYGIGFSVTVMGVACVIPLGKLTASLSATPLVVPQGGRILVTMTVSNSGGLPIWSVTPTAALRLSSTSFVVQAGGPAPLNRALVDACALIGCDVDPDACPATTFTWTVTALAPGTVSFSASVWWTESVFMTVSVTGAASNTVYVSAAPRLVAAASADPSTLKYGRPFTFRLTVTNTGGATVWNARPSLILSDSRFARVDLAPASLGTTLADGGSATWVWQMTALDGGTVKLTGGVGGDYNALSGTVMTGVSVSASATVLVTARPTGEIAVYPNPATTDRVTIYLALAGDASEVVVDAYDASMHRVFTGTWRNITWLDGNLTLQGLNRWAPGIYLIRARATLADGVTKTFPVAKLKVQR